MDKRICNDIHNNVLYKFRIYKEIINLIKKLMQDKKFHFPNKINIDDIIYFENALEKAKYDYLKICYLNIINYSNNINFIVDLNKSHVNNFLYKFSNFIKRNIKYKNRCIHNSNILYNDLVNKFDKLKNLATTKNIEIDYDICPKCKIKMYMCVLSDYYVCNECGFNLCLPCDVDKNSSYYNDCKLNEN